MEVHYDEGVAIHIDPEPCVDVCEDKGEASAGEHTGQVLSRERTYPGSRRRRLSGRQHGRARHGECSDVPAWSLDPGMRGSSLHGNREISRATACGSTPVRIGKARSRSR